MVADEGTATTTCSSGDITVAPDGSGIAVAGNLDAGQDSCTASVEVTSARSGSYTICGQSVTDRVGIDPPGCTTVTFTSLLMDAHAHAAEVDTALTDIPPIAPSDVSCTENSGTDDADLLNADLGALGSLGVITTDAEAAVTGTGTRSATARTTVAQVRLLGGLITADELRTTATAVGSITADGAGPVTISGSTVFTNLRVNGVRVSANPAPNTGITIPLVGSVLLNEQKPYAGGKGIVVNAISVKLLTGVRITVSGTHASLTTTPGPCPIP